MDVTKPRSFSRSNQQFKQSLLSHCGIAYWIVTPESLPSPDIIRAEFLDDADTSSVTPQPQSGFTFRAKEATKSAPTPRRAPFRTQPAPLTVNATAPAPLDADLQETRGQLHEILFERRRSRSHQRAANDDKKPLSPPSRKGLSPATISKADLTVSNSFFVSLNEEKDRDAMIAMLSAARQAVG